MTLCAILCIMTKELDPKRRSGYGFDPRKVAGALLLTAGGIVGAVKIGQGIESVISQADSSPVATLTADLNNLHNGGKIGYLPNQIVVSYEGQAETVKPLIFKYDGHNYFAYLHAGETSIWSDPIEAGIAVDAVIGPLPGADKDPDIVSEAHMNSAGEFLNNRGDTLPNLGIASLIPDQQS